QPAEAGDVVLEARGLTRDGAFRDVSFGVRRGVVVGLGGLVGAGRTEVARAIFGADPLDAGEIRLEGRPVRVHSQRDAISLGIGLVPEDRKLLGLVLGMGVRENVTRANPAAVAPGGFINPARERAAAAKYIQDLMIRTPSGEQTVRNLS